METLSDPVPILTSFRPSFSFVPFSVYPSQPQHDVNMLRRHTSPPLLHPTESAMTLAFSPASSIDFLSKLSISSIMEAANTAPPISYFCYLMAAGVGVPVSEDALVIFVGTLLTQPNFSVARKVSLLAWVYSGVVMSDMVTYSLGVGFRRGMFNPLRRLLLGNTINIDEGKGSAQNTWDVSPDDHNRHTDTEVSETESEVYESSGVKTTSSRATDSPGKSSGVVKGRRGEDVMSRALATIRRSGRFVGVAERFAVGMRGPTALLCGAMGVPAVDFGLGVALGALGTMPLQLSIGLLLRDQPKAVASVAAAFVSYYALGPAILTAATSIAALWTRGKKGRKNLREKGEEVEEASA
ncbi:unnamed protein product [Choristocarpus tenellus]